ncbi:monovalent cation/H+ antiporter complex subunit F [Actinomadura atramentaria]|uniref:monovalent cation/H+ antiporter complex subunit F n=1 Tax=Actinomadura atramentaria TaxID=1990 RepID=UPI00036B990B|nr:monovalent cation/H+ antiporter complex subunit F [Actinomadura atramentaria]
MSGGVRPEWALPALVLLAGGLAPCLAAVLRGGPLARLAALSAAGADAALLLVLLSVAYARPAYLDAALLLALLSPAGVLVYARFFGRIP